MIKSQKMDKLKFVYYLNNVNTDIKINYYNL